MQKAIIHSYDYLIKLGSWLKSPLLFLLRLYFGYQFIYHGYEKLTGIDSLATMLQEYHFPFPYLNAYLAGCAEFFGGICLLLGFASRLAAIPLIFTMIVAYATVHVAGFKAFFHEPTLFVEQPPFNYLLTALLVLAFGPGRLSIDYLLEKYFFKKA